MCPVAFATNGVADEQNRLVRMSIAVSQSSANDSALGGAGATERGPGEGEPQGSGSYPPAPWPLPSCLRAGEVFLFLETLHLLPRQ